MGKGGKPTVGFWYRVAYHHGITTGPIDAFLEFRGGDKTAWQGELTASGTININAPNLWGGEKDQGGIVGDVDVMFGEPIQTPNDYLVSVFGNQTAAWRGFTTLAFKGGRYGAMNPYPQKPSYKFRQILQGWDGGECWYPETALIGPTTGGSTVPPVLSLDAANATVEPSPGVTFETSATDTLTIRFGTGLPFGAWSRWPNDSSPPAPADGAWWCNFSVKNAEGMVTNYLGESYLTEEAALSAAIESGPIVLTGSTSYTFWLPDDVLLNRGGLSLILHRASGIGAINPAHVLYYSRTNSDMGREPEANINTNSLEAAANKLYGEGFGICPKWDPANESVEDFEQRICKLIGGSFTRSLEDGQWYLDLARGDYVLEDLPILTDDDILEFKEQPSILDNAINSVSVSYFDPERKETIVTAPVRAMGLVASYGTIHQTNEYPEIPTGALAANIALRDMLATATPTRAFDLITTRRTYAWRPNQYFRLQSPKRGIANMVCIVGDKQSGTLKSGAIRMKAAQDIYGMPTTSFVQVEPGVDTRPPQTPTAISLQRSIEAPYIEVASQLLPDALDALRADVGFAMAVAAAPGRELSYTMMVAPSGGDYADEGNGEWCATATVNETAGPGDTAFTLANGVGLGSVSVGDGALWDDEIVRVDAIDPAAGTITVGRGCADTVPSPSHAADSRLWFYPTGFAYDTTQISAAETVDVKLLSNTGSQQLPLASASAMHITFVGRHAFPYPPGALKIGGVAYPATVTGSFTVTWAHRNRVTQADMLVDTTAASITPAPNTRYGLRLLDASDALLIERTDIGPATATVVLNYTGGVTLELYTIDAIGISLQRHRITFAYAPGGTVVTAITATAYTPVYDGIIVDGGA